MKTVLVAVGTVLVCALLALPSYAQVINGCYQKNNGQLRILTAPGDACRSSEVAIQWNDKGDKGDTGATGATGAAGTQGPRGPAGESARSYVPGVLSVGNSYRDCTEDDEIRCEPRASILLALPDQTAIHLHAPVTRIISDADGEPTDVGSTDHISMYRPPRSGSTCRGAEPRSNAVEIEVLNDESGASASALFCVSPDEPVYNPVEDEFYAPIKNRLLIVAAYAADSLIRLTLPLRDDVPVWAVQTLSEGVIVGASHVGDGSDSAQLDVTIQDAGGLAANYLVTVTGFTGCVEPVAAQPAFLQSLEVRTVSFALHRCDDAGFPGDSATITLLSGTGHVYSVLWHSF